MAERSVKAAADGAASISDVIVSGIIGTPIEPVSARISALTLAHVSGRDFAAGMAFAKLVFYSQSFPKNTQVFLRGAGWYFSMEYSPDDMAYHLRFTAPAGQHDIWSSLGGWSGCQLGDFSFDAYTRTAAVPFGAATTVNIEDDVAPLWEAGFYSGFRAVGAGADLSAWFTNLPAGLSAAAEAAASEEIEAFVPAASASAGVRLAVQPNENAVFAIRDGATSAVIYDVAVAGYADRAGCRGLRADGRRV